ncbi:branched-chain amino acid ABC transporter permease [Nonomuraea sp. MCN248]|uniref:Branched-chain amino acid ABC transporter permease n=1 Tax=Nonomuraea corallina TaxID=2989783 RepID=A0ABT4S7N2_9ACTN|nr:branched-chain amino acid ABC transporter permease [Nonomuraea corallina]MDA0633218.1 branched-chain amino acid ABC transporter permease [Nonomuraea corallina]
MTGTLETIIRGLGNGSVYALLALGFVIIYKATRVISFAQPALMLAGAVAVSYLAPVTGFYLGALLAALLIAAVALGIERVAIRPMVGRPVFVVAIITLGIDVVVRVVVNSLIGRDVRQVGDPWGFDLVALGPLVVQQRWLAMMAAAAALVTLLFAFFRHSKYGLAMRAAAYDQETALAQGVSVSAVFAVSWALAGFLAAVAGMFVGTGQGIEQTTWIVALKALPAIIVGGLDSLGGAVAGGLVIGVVESLFQSYQGAYLPWLGQNFAIVSPYVVMLVVLLVRPYGLFGTREVERV